MNAPTTEDCLDCIDGMSPGTSPVLGTCYQVCLTCQPPCPCCHGNGCFPAWTTDMAAYIASVNDTGQAPVLCHTCGGVVDLTPLAEENPP